MSDDGILIDAEVIARRDRRKAPPPPPTWLEAAGASWRLNQDDQEDYSTLNYLDAYAQVEDALVAQGRARTRYNNPAWRTWHSSAELAPQRFDQLWADVEEARRLNPNAFVDIPATRKDFERWAYSRRGEHQRDQAVAAQGGTGSSVAPALAFGMLRMGGDAQQLATLPMGGGGKTLASTMLRQAAAGVQGAAMFAPQTVTARANMGEGYSSGDLAQDLVIGGAVNAGFVGAHVAVAKGVPALDAKLYDAAAPLRKPIDTMFADRDLARAFSQAVPSHLRTPEQQAAMNVLAREGEIDAGSPYVDTHAGAAMNRQRMGAIVPGADRKPVPRRGGGLKLDIVDGLTARGFSRSQARGIAAGIHAESTSNARAVNPKSGALGVGQWLGPRKAALIKRYGPNPSLEQQLDFLAWELRGGDQGGKHVLAAGDEAGVLNAYIRKFMRPKAGFETDSDLARGMKALGREGDAAPSSAAADSGDSDLAAALGAEAADLDAQRARLELDARTAALEADPTAIAHDTELPQLRRELFDNEVEWRLAQAASDAEALGLDAPLVTRQSVWAEARDRMVADKGGEAEGVLFHPEVGPIDVKWGNAKGGLAHIVAKHQEVLDRLPELIEEMQVVHAESSANRLHLESLDHVAKVRLDWDGKQQKWLLTAFEKERKAPPAAEDGGAAGGARDHSPGAGAAGDIGAGGGQGKLPDDLAALGSRYGYDDTSWSGFYRFETPRGPVVWDPTTGHANGAVPRRTNMSADDLRAALRDNGVELGDPVAAMHMQEQALAGFDDPMSARVAAQAESLAHDLRVAADAGALDGLRFAVREGDPADARLAMAQLDEEVAALDALRGCL